MIPNSKIKSTVTAMAFSICTLTTINCSQDRGTSGADIFQDANTAKVALQMNYSSTPLIDSLVLDCQGADTLHFVTDPNRPYMELDLFPGNQWLFSAKLYANGSLMQTGEITAKLEAGSNVNLDIQMHALVGFVYVEIPLGFGNTAGITSGTLTLNDGENTYAYPMEIAGSTAVFKSGTLELGKKYSITLALNDESGTEIYRVEDSFTLDENAPIPELQIKSLRSKVSIALRLADEVEMLMNATLPASTRKPQINDIVISEFLVTPVAKDSGTYGFIELYNGSNDSLRLENCAIGKTVDAKDGASIVDQVLPPRQVLVLSIDTNENVPMEYQNTTAVPIFLKSNSGTAASIVFHCDGTILDSLYYGKIDSLHTTALPIGSTSASTSKSTQLNLDQWNDRENPENWCQGIPSPGIIGYCN